MMSNHLQVTPHTPPPFEHSWKMYYENFQKKELQELINISDVGQFWGAVNTLWSISTFGHENIGTTFHMMRDDIKPLWEDPSLVPGGNLNIIIPENILRKHRKDTNELWLALLMNCVGEQFDTNEIVGCTISRRPNKMLIRIWDAHPFPKDTKPEDRAKELVTNMCSDNKLDKQHIRIMNKALSIYYKDHASCHDSRESS